MEAVQSAQSAAARTAMNRRLPPQALEGGRNGDEPRAFMAKIELARVHNTRTFFSLFEDGRAGRIQRTSCGLDCFHALRAHVQMYGSVTVYGLSLIHI